MRWLSIVIMLWFLSFTAAAEPVRLALSGYYQENSTPLILSQKHLDWLAQKKELHVAVYGPDNPPLVQSTLTGRYRGMNADYLEIIKHRLSTPITIIHYKNKQHAIDALENGDVDTILSELSYEPQNNQQLDVSSPIIYSWPTLVTSIHNVMKPLQSHATVSVAVVNHSPGEDFIRRSFPQAKINSYETHQEALTSLVNEKNTYFIGDSLSVSALLSLDYGHELNTVKYWNTPLKKSEFIFRHSESPLKEIMNNVLSTIDNQTRYQVAQSEIDKSNLSFMIGGLNLTEREQQWLKKNKSVKIIINPWFAPFTMVDSNQEPRGIIGDILNLISLQTGLKFETVIVRSNDEMISVIKNGNWNILQTATFDHDRARYVSFTHPFLSTRFVTVVRKSTNLEPKLANGMRVAISSEHTLLSRLKSKYPEISWVQVDNSSVAINLVATGKVDAAVSNQLTVRYISEHYYPEQLSFMPLDGEPVAAISFAVSNSEPELKQILEKALDNIPRKEILQIVSKWIRLPDIKIDTWELYNKQFYLVAWIAVLIVTSCIVWALYLLEVSRRRKRAQLFHETERIRAQNENNEKRHFLSRMSHEIRTPVSAIMGYLELLQISSAELKPQDQSSVEQATLASRTLLTLIGDILDLEKIESGIIDVDMHWVNPNHELHKRIKMLNALAEQKKILLDFTTEINSDTLFFMDNKLLGQVLVNVVGNAIKFTENGSVSILASESNGLLVINVQDTGPGISASDQETLFMTFTQGEMGEKHGGSGLGLSICKALMTRMNGSILIQSSPGEGTLVTIQLPVKIGHSIESVSDNSSPEILRCETGLRILIADDHPTSRSLLLRQLAELGIHAEEAADGKMALEKIRINHFDILITDVNMPVMDGITLTQTLRKSGNNIVIYGLTASAQEHERKRCLNAGMNACIFKPVNLLQLSTLLNDFQPICLPAFDVNRLSFLAKGNSLLMKIALEEAQTENYKDYRKVSEAILLREYHTAATHLHRIKGAAQLLGAHALEEHIVKLEDCLISKMDDGVFLTKLHQIQGLLKSIDECILRLQ